MIDKAADNLYECTKIQIKVETLRLGFALLFTYILILGIKHDNLLAFYFTSQAKFSTEKRCVLMDYVSRNIYYNIKFPKKKRVYISTNNEINSWLIMFF